MNSRVFPRIEKPCPANLGSMPGDEKRRFCAHCQLHVHNLSAMTPDEQSHVMKEAKERICVTYVLSPNSKVVSAPVWKLHQRLAKGRRLAAAAAMALLSVVAPGCATSSKPVEAPRPIERTSTSQFVDGKQIAGGICPPPHRPFWKRLLGLH